MRKSALMPGMEPVRAASPTTAADLVALLDRVAQRDRVAFKTLYDATSLKLFGIVLRILRRRDVAEDILQDVYIKIWDKAADYRGNRGAVITWMATIARNRALDEARRAPPVIAADDVPGFEDIAANVAHPLADRERQEEYARLMRCLNQLEAEKRSMITLAYLEGLSREALAARFDKPVATVKTWLRRGLEAVKGCLQT